MRCAKRPGLAEELRATVLGAIIASGVLGVLLTQWGERGTPELPRLQRSVFAVAILAGPKQAAQQAPKNADRVVEAIATPAPKATQAVTAQRATSLPEAVAAAPEAAPGIEATAPEEVQPPARVSMPGGQLAVEDSDSGEQVDVLAVGRQQVFIRLFVDRNGKVVRGGIVRNGSDPMRDVLILKVMMSRSYRLDHAIRAEGSDQGQIDLVLDYGVNDYVP